MSPGFRFLGLPKKKGQPHAHPCAVARTGSAPKTMPNLQDHTPTRPRTTEPPPHIPSHMTHLTEQKHRASAGGSGHDDKRTPPGAHPRSPHTCDTHKHMGGSAERRYTEHRHRRPTRSPTPTEHTAHTLTHHSNTCQHFTDRDTHTHDAKPPTRPHENGDTHTT
jgi:hypothetical protein